MFMAFNLGKHKRLLVVLLVVIAVVMLGSVIFSRLFPLKYKDYIAEYSQRYNIDPVLVCSVINVESRFKKDAVSIKGASGLMQIMPSTANWYADNFGITDFNYDEHIFEPEKNINIGCWYLNVLSKQYGGNTELVLAAYNAGSGNVSKWLNNSEYSKTGTSLDLIPFKETRNYVKKVNGNMKIYRWYYK